jgi:pimeloyl-ACP methyl ester carboxylesterase
VVCLPPEWGAEAVLRPQRRAVDRAPGIPHEDVSFAGADGAQLRGWRFRGSPPRRGLLVYLHGIGDNRQGGVGLAKRFGPKGWDVLAYDARAHGASGGSDCTYGVLEKADLVRALDAVSADRVVLFGCSLGAAVALQAAPLDARVRA